MAKSSLKEEILNRCLFSETEIEILLCTLQDKEDSGKSKDHNS